MSISKTRQKLVDVARQLFAKNGIANTTMNDIAVASGKGRRTLYTYFSRKEDVYYAVIESELDRLSEKLEEVASCKMRPQDKIIELIYTHLSMIKETVVRNGNLRAEFFRNIWMVEKARKNFDEDEIEILRKIYSEGKEDVYYAVIESELERLSDRLDEVANCKMRPQDKIIELIYTHLSMIKETVVRNGNLRAEFFRNIWMVEKVRKNFDEDEIEILRRIYREGKDACEFDIDNVDLVADITHYCIKGLEVPFIYGRLGHGMNVEASKPLVAKVVYGALGKSGLKL